MPFQHLVLDCLQYATAELVFAYTEKKVKKLDGGNEARPYKVLAIDVTTINRL